MGTVIGATALSRRDGSLGGSVVRRASRVLGHRSVQRLLAVGGLAVAGWLLSGGGTAFADQVRPDDGARHKTGAPVHPAPVNDRSAKATASQPSAELDVLAGRARRTGSHTAHHAQAQPHPAAKPQPTDMASKASGESSPEAARGTVPKADGDPAWKRGGGRASKVDGTAPEGLSGLAPDASPDEGSKCPLRSGGKAALGRLGDAPVVRELPSPAPYEPGVPSLRPVTGVPGDTIADVGARTTTGDEASAPAPGVKASAPDTTGEGAAGPAPASAAAHSVGDDDPGTPRPDDRQPASSGSSGAARLGAAGETVPLGTARTGALPYGPSLLTRATPAPRGEVPAMRTAADEPSFSPD